MTPLNVTTAMTRDVIQHIQLILNLNRYIYSANLKIKDISSRNYVPFSILHYFTFHFRLRSATKILLKNVTLNMKIKLSMKVLKFVMKDLSEIAKEKVNVIYGTGFLIINFSIRPCYLRNALTISFWF